MIRMLNAHQTHRPSSTKGAHKAPKAAVRHVSNEAPGKALKRAVFAGSLALVLALLFAAAPAMAATSASAADTALVAHGEYLAKVGDCAACHTAPRGKPFAGGLPMTTPLGKVYTTNITPDPDTGIGRYTEADFVRAMREGVAKDGHNLYPAMPYPSYAKVSDEDLHAMYAYFMHGVAPVKQANRESDIPWPLNMRWPLKAWNLVFLDRGVYRNKAGQDATWNRGAYLVQGLGHCGACHTPRGITFQEKALDESSRTFLTGGELEGWFASNLSGDHNTGLGRWSEADIAMFLKTGANAHASAFGSMTDVVNNSTQWLTDPDATAIARYLKSLPQGRGETGPRYAYDAKATLTSLTRPAHASGARVYATYCLHCHGADGNGYAPLFAPLAGNPNVLEPNASSLINVTLNGTGDLVIQGVPAAYPMPKYANELTDQQIADVLTFIRSGWGNAAPAVSAADVGKMRQDTQAAK